MRKFFSKGLAALLPTLITIAILYLGLKTVYLKVGIPIGEVLKWSAVTSTGRSEESLRPSHPAWNHFFNTAPILGCILGFVLIFTIGAVVATLFGKKLVAWLDTRVGRFPIVRLIYPYARQFADALFSVSGQKTAFEKAVAVRVPSQPVWSIGFMTSEGLRHLSESTRQSTVAVYFPKAPHAFTGSVRYVALEDVVPLPMTVGETMILIFSYGILSPQQYRAEP